MSSKNLLIRILLLALAFALTGCAPATATPGSAIAQTPRPTSATLVTLTLEGESEESDPTHTPEPAYTLTLSNVAPPGVFSPTPDLNIIATQIAYLTDIPPAGPTPVTDLDFWTISAIIEGSHSQEEIAGILFSKWLEHFEGENISLSYRLEGYSIKQIEVNTRSRCTINFGGVDSFFAEASVILKTTLPLMSRTYEHSDWVAGGGNVLDDHTTTKTFNGLIYTQNYINFILLVNGWAPPCD